MRETDLLFVVLLAAMLLNIVACGSVTVFCGKSMISAVFNIKRYNLYHSVNLINLKGEGSNLHRIKIKVRLN